MQAAFDNNAAFDMLYICILRNRLRQLLQWALNDLRLGRFAYRSNIKINMINTLIALFDTISLFSLKNTCSLVHVICTYSLDKTVDGTCSLDRTEPVHVVCIYSLDRTVDEIVRVFLI